MPGRTQTHPSLENPARLAATLFSSLDLAKTAAACTAFAAEMLQVDAVRLYLISGATVKMFAGVHDGASNGRERTRVPKALAQRLLSVAAQREPALDEDGTTLVPICVADRPVGVLAVEAASGPSANGAARNALSTVAALVGVALGNALAFRDAQERADRLADLERTKSQFLNLASHELRGPLTVLMGYLSLLEDGAFGEVPHELAATLPAINARISEMDALISAMLETARLEDDRLELSFTEEDLCDIAADAISRAQAFTEPGQKLTLSHAPERAPATVDRARITLVIGNLVNNAIKYSVEHTDVHCEVRVDGDDVLVAVHDRGVGIAEADIPTLFTRFGRVRRDPAVRAIAGTGLGLFLARELARAHGGDVTVESEPGQGSTFTLRVPSAR